MAPRVQRGTKSRHQDLEKLSRDLHVIQLHRSSQQNQDGSILTEILIPRGKLYYSGSIMTIINRYDTMSQIP
jgi:hypothetical protein